MRTLSRFALVLLFTTTSLLAAELTTQTSVSTSSIQWNAAGTYDRLVLTVGGPDGFVLRREFDAGRIPALQLEDFAGKADGSYTWELRAVPHISEQVREQLARARAANDDVAIARIRADAHLDREAVAAGAFAIRGGAFVTAVAETAHGRKITADTLKPAPNDVVTADDEIIQGSLCVGLDCVVNESFAFDTIRLKENNNRITFQDTSTTAGCPNNVWTLTANDTCGGANKFSIDDVTGAKTPFTVIAGAPTNSMFVASSGKLGLGNNSPGLHVHITATDTPAIRQEQTNGGGFTAQTWDIGANEANWFVRDLTAGSRLPFRIRPGAPTSSIDISASGNVGIGTASPMRRLHAIGGAGAVPLFPTIGPLDMLVLENNSNSSMAFVAGNGSSTMIRFIRNGATASNGWLGYLHMTDDLVIGAGSVERIRVSSVGNVGFGVAPTQPIQHSNGAYLSAGGVWTNASSRDLKQDICELDSSQARQTLRDLKPVTYAYRRAPDEHHAGFIAEDSPDLVASKDHKGMSAMDIAAVLTKVVQDQQATIEQLKQRIEELEKHR